MLTGIHVDSKQNLWGVGLTDFDVLYEFGFTVPIAPGDASTVNTINGANGVGTNDNNGAIFQNLGDPNNLSPLNGFNLTDYEYEVWDTISFGGLAGDCNDGKTFLFPFFSPFFFLFILF